MSWPNGTWVDAGNDPFASVLRKAGIVEVYFDIRQSRLTPTYLDTIRGQGFAPGFHADWNWPEVPTSPGGFAAWIDQRMKQIGWLGNAPIHINDEIHDASRIATLLKTWRSLRPKRRTLWTMEGHQAPIFAGIADVIVQANVEIGPQCYVGPDMIRIESASEVQAWASLGIPVERIRPFLNASQLGAWWTGIAYTQGLLPQ